MIELLSQDVPDTIAGAGLLVAGVATLVWGVVSLLLGWSTRQAPIPRNFPFWLGMFLLVADTGIYLILGYGVIHDPSGTPLWGVLYAIACGIVAIAAFFAWARERMR